jgi:hypothetical protein
MMNDIVEECNENWIEDKFLRDILHKILKRRYHLVGLGLSNNKIYLVN